jgi:8-oxo-dGTP pyrophosphatase MutT (NUDIX family)
MDPPVVDPSAMDPPGAPSNPIPRRAARVILINRDGRVLMFRGLDPGRPGLRYWFTVGGGIDDDEPPAVGAAREMREETGLDLAPESLGEPVWHELIEFPFDGRWYRQDQDFFLLRVDDWDVTYDGFDAIERDSIDGHRWWSVEELETTQEEFYPPELPALLHRLLDA